MLKEWLYIAGLLVSIFFYLNTSRSYGERPADDTLRRGKGPKAKGPIWPPEQDLDSEERRVDMAMTFQNFIKCASAVGCSWFVWV